MALLDNLNPYPNFVSDLFKILYNIGFMHHSLLIVDIAYPNIKDSHYDCINASSMISSIFSEHSATQMENGLNLELDFAFFIAYASLSNIPHFLRVVSDI